MNTISTKLSPKKDGAANLKKDEVGGEYGDGISTMTWRILFAAIMIAGTVLRLVSLSLVPLHHDEGVNGNFLVTLVREGPSKYQYNPENYHGPTLYFFSAVIPWLARFFGGKDFGDAHGLTTFNIRLVTAAFGVATIWLAPLLRKRIGAIGALSAAALIAISPGAVYLSRYFIHESLFVFFTLAIVVAALKYYETTRTTYLVLATISAALMTATKETWIINGPVLLIALVATNIYFRLRARFRRSKRVSLEPGFRDRLNETIERLGGPIQVTTVALVALTVFILVNVAFYSSFFTNYPKGVHDALSTLNMWRHRTHEHAHPFLQYIEWLRQEESPLLLLGTLGAAIAVWRSDNRFAVFAALWTFGSLLAYSLVQYKTPWISLNFIVPLAITGGYAIDQLYKKSRELWIPIALIAGTIAILAFGNLIKLDYGDAGIRGLVWDFDFSRHWIVMNLLLLLSAYAGYVIYARNNEKKPRLNFYLASVLTLCVLGYQMYELNFVHYDDDQYPYVYAHTRRDLLSMIDEIDRVAKQMGTGNDIGIALVSPDYWPLPWYFRDYKRVGYYQQIVPATEPIIIGRTNEAEQLEKTYGHEYQLVKSGLEPDGSYSLRPGVDLLLYVRRDVRK